MPEDELMQLIIKADPRPDVPELYAISGMEYRHFERFAALVEAAITSPAEAKEERFVGYAITSQRPIPPEHMAKRLQALIAAEREACAKVAEQYGWSGECRHVAAAIRARGEKP